MSKATIEFNLDDPCDKYEFIRATKATDVYIALHDLYTMLRRYNKYGQDELEKMKPTEVAEEIYERFFQILEDHKIHLFDELE